jgi:hypothetical protein
MARRYEGAANMSSADGRGHHRAPLPVGRLPPFICLHQQQAQDAQNLLLAAFIITPYPQSPLGLTTLQAQMVKVVQAQLIGDCLAGRFPGAADAIWLDIITGRSTPLSIPNENWLRHRMRDYLTVTLNVPKPEAGQAVQR